MLEHQLQITLVGNRIMVEQVKKEAEGSFALSDVSGNNNQALGRVVAVSPDVEGNLMGKLAIFDKYDGREVELDGQLFKVLYISNDKDSEVLGFKD